MGRPLVVIVALLGFLCAALFGFSPATPQGIQCPTAPVQAVVVRDCCGRAVVRAPRPGERAFLQCRCAEKKAASTKATVAQKVTLFLVEDAPMGIVDALPSSWAFHPYAAREATWSSPPALRPPTAS